MSAGIKRMLAERKKLAKDQAAGATLDRKWDRIAADVMAMIDKAAPFMDEGSDPTKWAPSTKLKLTYFVAATAELAGGEKRAVQFILLMLDKARRLWTEGLHPDPWADNPIGRSNAATRSGQ